MPCCPLFRSAAARDEARRRLELERGLLAGRGVGLHPTSYAHSTGNNGNSHTTGATNGAAYYTHGAAPAVQTWGGNGASSYDAEKAGDSHAAQNAAIDAHDVSEEKLRPLERFMHNQLFTFTERFRWPILVVFVAAFGLGLAYTATLRPPEEADQWFPPKHLLQASPWVFLFMFPLIFFFFICNLL
jgi:hypothetical protein